jgi:hypothetical protein
MSDSDDDWENAMDDAIAEKPKEEETKKVDEDDSDEEPDDRMSLITSLTRYPAIK